MRPKCLADRIFGAGTSAPSMLRASTGRGDGQAHRDDGAGPIARKWTLADGGPGRGRVGARRGALVRGCGRETVGQLWHNGRSELGARCEHAADARQRIAGWRDERAQTRDALDGRHDAAA